MRAGRIAVPSGVDPEAAELLWPLLATGASREVLVGRVAVGMGLDTATAGARVERMLVALSAAGVLV